MRNKILFRVIIAVTLALLVGISVSLLAFNYIYISSSKENLKTSSQFVVNEIKEAKNIEEINLFLENHEESLLGISVFSSSFELIGDANADNVIASAYQDEAYQKKALNSESYFKICNPYKDQSSMMTYTVKVRNENIASDGFIIVRVSNYIFYNNAPFWYAITVGAAMWVLLVFLMTFSVNSAVKSAVEPLQDIEKSLVQISKGEYRVTSHNYNSVPEFETFYIKLDEISVKISDTLRDLKYEQMKSKFMLESINQGIIAVSKKGTIMLNNKAVLDIFDRDSIIGMPLEMLFDDGKIVTSIKNSLKGNNYSVNILRKEQDVYRIEALASAYQWDEQLGEISMLLILTNITQEINNSAIRSEFFANASHELKTPLTAISGYSELMTLPTTTSEQKVTCATEINHNAVKMKSLLDDMMKLSRLDAQLDSEEQVSIDIRQVCDKVAEEQKVIAEKMNIAITVEGKAVLFGKKGMITTLVTNLVNNAIKYNKKNGKVDITIDEQADKITLRIADTGIGIAPKYQNRLFERFYKVDNSRRRSEETSTGLGLAIVKKIALEHNATIELESELNKGTTIKIVFAKS